MSKRHSLWVCVVVLLTFRVGLAQDNSEQPPADATPQQPAPAYGPDNATPSISENPPISGLDMPNLEPHAAPLSYLQAGAHILQSADSNIENSLGGSAAHSITDALGSLDLQRLWSNYDLSLQYLGGVGYYAARGLGFKQIEELGFDQKITWKRGEFGIRDAFSYQPEGTFGSGYGSIATAGAALSGQSTFLGGSGLGALGQVPRLMNLALADVVENLTPKSTVTATGGYGFVHFLANDPETGNSFIGNSQITGEVAYDRLLGPRDQGAVMYGYQGFSFSTGISFHSHVIQLIWGHRISGRMNLLIAAGPQFTQLNNIPTIVSNPTSADTVPPCEIVGSIFNPALECFLNDFRISAAGRILLRYRFHKLSLEAAYDHYITSGSGFFAGAESDTVHLNLERPLGRIWTAFSNLGYSRNAREVPLTVAQIATCTPTQTNPNSACPGVSGNVYQYGFAGIGVRRNFGRTLKAFVSYQLNDLHFDSSFCGTAGPCNRTAQRQVGTVGLDWTPRPMRLD